MASGSKAVMYAAMLGLIGTFVGVFLAQFTGILLFDYNDAIDSWQVEADIAAINLAIRQKFPEVKRVFVEAEKRGNRYPPYNLQGNG